MRSDRRFFRIWSRFCRILVRTSTDAVWPRRKVGQPRLPIMTQGSLSGLLRLRISSENRISEASLFFTLPMTAYSSTVPLRRRRHLEASRRLLKTSRCLIEKPVCGSLSGRKEIEEKRRGMGEEGSAEGNGTAGGKSGKTHVRTEHSAGNGEERLSVTRMCRPYASRTRSVKPYQVPVKPCLFSSMSPVRKSSVTPPFYTKTEPPECQSFRWFCGF